VIQQLSRVRHARSYLGCKDGNGNKKSRLKPVTSSTQPPTASNEKKNTHTHVYEETGI